MYSAVRYLGTVSVPASGPYTLVTSEKKGGMFGRSYNHILLEAYLVPHARRGLHSTHHQFLVP